VRRPSVDLEYVNALTGVLWKDDGAVFDEQCVKVYPLHGDDPACRVVVQAVKLSRRKGPSPTDLAALTASWRSLAQLFEGE